MGKSAILAIRIIGDATAAVTALEKVDGSAKSMQATMDKASVGAGIALGALTAAAVGAGNAASELQQATGAVDSVFGEYADKVHKYAATAADDVGLSKEAYSQMSAVLGSQLKNMGVEMDLVSGKSNDLIGVGADLAATFGGTTADAVGAITSLLRGERNPIERYGVSLKQVDIDAKMAAMGLEGLTGEAEKAAVTQATLALLMEQTAAAEGQFGREADTAAGMQQRANAAWTDAQAALGEQLLPIMAEGATIAADLAKWMGENSDVVTILALVIGGLAAGILVINGAMKAYAAIQAIQTAAQWASNAAWLASPVTWIVLAVVAAIALVVAGVMLVIEYWDEIMLGAEIVWGAIVGWIEDAYNWLVGKLVKGITDVMAFFDNLGKGVAAAFSSVVKWIKDAYNWLLKLVGNAVPGWVKDLLGMGGKTFTAKTVMEEPAMRASSLAYSAGETMAAFSFNTTTATAPAPTTFAKTTAAPTLADLGSLGSSATAPSVTNIYKITIEGAIDKDGTARAIREVMEHDLKNNGKLVAAGQSWH